MLSKVACRRLDVFRKTEEMHKGTEETIFYSRLTCARSPYLRSSTLCIKREKQTELYVSHALNIDVFKRL